MCVYSQRERRMMDSLPRQLRQRVEELGSQNAEARSVINDLIKHFSGQSAQVQTSQQSSLDEFRTVFTDLSMILPERRKVALGINEDEIAVMLSSQVLHSGSFKTYNVALCLPVPKRPKPTWNLVLTNVGGEGPWIVLSLLGDIPADKHSPQAKATESLREAVFGCLQTQTRVSMMLDAVPKLAVTSYIGAKEGVLYLLDEFVFFGYKKPLILLSHAEIESVSFTVVTRLTFNIVVQLVDGRSHEFGMISHDHYEAIHRYISKTGLDDHSLAEERKAKRFRTTADEPSALAEAEAEAKEEPAVESDMGDETDDSEDLDYSTNRADSGGSGESSSESEQNE